VKQRRDCDLQSETGYSGVAVTRSNVLAEWTGLEPATPGVTGRYSNQLNYHSSLNSPHRLRVAAQKRWRPLGDSNPCNHRERVVS
jgi:hypothetical protein